MWSRIAANLPAPSNLSLDRVICRKAVYCITVEASSNNAASPTSLGAFGPKSGFYELNLQDLVDGTPKIHDNDKLEQILCIVQTEPTAPAQYDQIGNSRGVVAFEVGTCYY